MMVPPEPLKSEPLKLLQGEQYVMELPHVEQSKLKLPQEEERMVRLPQ
jgi:hypothetical protein